jgi:hypothetical protein
MKKKIGGNDDEKLQITNSKSQTIYNKQITKSADCKL